MANVELIDDLESAGKVTPEKALNPNKAPDLQSDNVFPDRRKNGRKKRKKSISSPPGNHPCSERKGNKFLNQSEATGSKEAEDPQSQRDKEEIGSKAKGSKEYVGLPALKIPMDKTKYKANPMKIHKGVRTQRQRKQIQDREISMEEEMDTIAVNSKPPNFEEGEPVTQPRVGPLPLQFGEYAQNPTYSGNFNQLTTPLLNIEIILEGPPHSISTNF